MGFVGRGGVEVPIFLLWAWGFVDDSILDKKLPIGGCQSAI